MFEIKRENEMLFKYWHHRKKSKTLQVAFLTIFFYFITIYAMAADGLHTSQQETFCSFRYDLESIRRDLRDLRNNSYMKACSICFRRAVTPRIELTHHPSYCSAYDDWLVKPPSPPIIYHHPVHMRPEARSSWDPFWLRNKCDHECSYRRWITSRYVY